MAVKVGNSWVSEAAYTYAKAKQGDSGTGSMLSQLSEKFQGTEERRHIGHQGMMFRKEE